MVYCYGVSRGGGGTLQQGKEDLEGPRGEVSEEDLYALIRELGDAGWYFAQTASELHTSLEFILKNNLEKLADRKRRGVLGGSGDDR